MGKKKAKINNFMFAPDQVSIRLIASRNSKIDDFETIVSLFKRRFKKLNITLNKEAIVDESFEFYIESDTYIKFSKIKEIFTFLEDIVIVSDEVVIPTDNIFF